MPDGAPRIGLTNAPGPGLAYYLAAIEGCGGQPVLLETDAAPAEALAQIDGLLLPGGGDIHSERYGAPLSPFAGEIEPERDEFEIGLVRGAMEAGMPLLGICRGHQVLNVALGGSLWQDLQIEREAETHEHRFERWDPRRFHRVMLVPGTRIARLAGRVRMWANSHHHQAVRHLADGLIVAARSESDGVVEALETACGTALSVQWHPERMDPDAWWPIRDLVERARRARSTGGTG